LPLLPYGCLDLGVPLAAALAAIGIAYGALCALAQSDVKKLVAYSSVSHLGFCVLGMFALNEEGITGSIVQSVNHGLSTGGLFLLIGMLYERYHSRDMNEVGGVAAKLPMLAILTVFMCLSSAGLPGLNGFVGEALTMVGMFRVHPLYAAVGASSVLLGAWYLFTLMRGSLFGPLKEPIVHEPIRDLNARELWTMIPICIACLWVGLYPRPMLDSMRTDVDVLVGYYNSTTPKRAQATADAAGPAIISDGAPATAANQATK
jgi:NADH-quinone oxidoreductase subunit M